MSATLRLERTMPGIVLDVEDRNKDWQIHLDGQPAGTIARNNVLELPVEPGHHTLQLTSTGRRQSPVRAFDVRDESMTDFRCHSQPIWPLMLMALVVPGRWIVLKQR
jgi:hypothetical protein